ncbi:5-methyltetrahydropteroyltriglutamate--homocysteine S-methyltransferase [Haloferula chungangensis]|uniref:5-methyltetrahydropteroyltriglutamate--homocysteine methyltransferase n=1 Tax=Haloferula chungangensis TaxID=1048331 RepID=A0ABW2L9H5_9BACT
MKQSLTTHISGYPRIGAKRELKKALEQFWAGRITAAELDREGKGLRQRHWIEQQRLNFVATNDFSFYDGMLDLACMLGAVPSRFGVVGEEVSLDQYFRMARGRGAANGNRPDVAPLELTKWFDTNYHYLVPELDADQLFRRTNRKAVAEVKEAIACGHRPKPVLIGPVTFLALSKTRDGSDPLLLLPKLLPVYRELLGELFEAGAEWVEISEPVVVQRKDGEVLTGVAESLAYFKEVKGPKLLLAVPFGKLGGALNELLGMEFDGLHVDAVRGSSDLPWLFTHFPNDKVLSLGLIDGRGIWRADLLDHRVTISTFLEKWGPARLWVGTSCSLLHVPHSLQEEDELDTDLKSWLSFAKEKLEEVDLLSKSELSPNHEAALMAARDNRLQHLGVRIPELRREVAALDAQSALRASDIEERLKLQRAALGLPLLPTTTIGSFPQTDEIRKLRARRRKGVTDEAGYEQGLEAAMRDVIRCQEELGIDVLVHGEFERTDMVEYFGEKLDGVAITRNGWVQSYGSRCVKPPIIWGDVTRPKTMTVDWTVKAQTLTSRHVKGMLTGPVTILQWSFVRDDLSRREVALQLALALRKEVGELEQAGTKVIQVDEPGLREGFPLELGDREAYLEWAVYAFRVATSGVADVTQIHTHMCYAEFEDVAEAIAALDVDVISLEASRSKMEALDSVRTGGLRSEVGPGVWDIHSPRVPSQEEIENLLERALQVVPAERLWVNPDCGLKTRGWQETRESLKNLVSAAAALRERAGRQVAELVC